MVNPIVHINASQRVAPTPSKLQKSGAFLSQGATSTSPGTYTLLTRLADLSPILKGALALTSLTWSGSVVTATTTAPHGLTVGDHVPITVSGATPVGYNGSFQATITGTSTFTYPLAANPGMETVPGVYTLEDVTELTAMNATFFAQGSQQAVWVLELGSGNAADGAAFLTTWIAANPGVFYSYLVPRYWDGDSAFLTMLATFEAIDSQTYFFVTTTLATYALYTGAMKCAFRLVEAPAYGKWAANVLTAISFTTGKVTATTTSAHGVVKGQWFSIAGVTPAGYNGTFLALDGTTGSTLVYALAADPGAETVLGTLVASLYASTGVPATEFTCASPFQITLNYKPSSTNKVTPLNLAFMFGVTQFPTQGNAAVLATLLAAGVSYVGDGSAGGISDEILVGGKMADGRPFNYWYSVDWAQIEVQLAVTATCINGSNDPINPLYYNQNGINTVQQVAASKMSDGITFGLVLNPVAPTQLIAAAFTDALDSGALTGFTVVNAIPFASYVAENPTDYAAGVYNGIAIDFTPQLGFESITINISASDFAG